MASTNGPLFHDDVPILHEGDRIFDHVRSDESGNPVVLTGGAKLNVSKAQPGYLGFLEIKQFEQTAFGPNRGKAVAVNPDSVVKMSDETGAGLQYRVDDSWHSPTRGPVEHELLASLSYSTSFPELVNICYPGYEPRAAVALAVELLLNDRTEGDVGLYIPGTQSHWGQKSDVRKEYGRYGLARGSRGNVDPISLEKIIPTAYVSQGTIKSDRESTTGNRLIVSKDLSEFNDVQSPEYLIASHLSRRTKEGEEEIQQKVNEPDISSVIRLWSPFTKREGEGAPKYGPRDDPWGKAVRPTVSTLEQIEQLDQPPAGRMPADRKPDTDNSRNRDLLYPSTTTDVDGYRQRTTISFEELDASVVSDALEDLFSEYQTFKDVNYHRAAQLIFNVQMFFERLPTPVGFYDRWVQDRSFEGEIYLPKLSEEYIDDLRSHDMDAEGGSLLHAIKTAEQIADLLRDENPMFDRIVEIVEDRMKNDESVAIYNSSKKGGIILREALLKYSEVEESDLGSNVYIVNSDSARELGLVNTIVFCGMQRPGQAGYYLHPRSTEVVVLAYSEWIGGAVRRHAEEALEDLHTFLGVSDSIIPNPNFRGLEVEEDPEPDFPEDEQGPTSTDPTTSSTTTSRSGGSSTPDEESSSLAQQNESIPTDLSDLDLSRLQDIADLEPTKNAELVDEWGYDSGSDLYQYLSSNLHKYYERNSNKYIVLSDEGHEVISNLD